jgi:hypothetical protein
MGIRAKPKNALDVDKLMSEFQEAEKSTSHHKGTFKIEKPFDDALDTTLKSKPTAKKPVARR